MNDAIQFSVMLANKPGVLATVCRHLAQEKVNIVALTMMDSTEHGVLRLVSEQPEKCREVLIKLNLPVTETKVLLTPLANRPGAIAEVAEKLSAEHINISYAYCTMGIKGGKALGVFKVANLKKAQKVLEQQNKRSRDMTVKLRRPVSLR
jgi:hypothetical protein